MKSLLLAAALLPGLSPEAGATTFRRLTLEEQVDLSDIIVRGTVTEVWVERDESGRVWTRAQVDVSEVLKGDKATEFVVVDQLGGEWAGMRMDMPGAARFARDEDIVVFIDVLRSGAYAPLGMANGKYTVRLDPRIRREIVQRVDIPLERVYDPRFLPLPSEAMRVEWSDLATRVRARVAAAPTAPAEN
jgi:hypothetical protein